MIKHILLYSVFAIAAIVLISGTLYNTGSPGKKTGSPLDGGTCISCHTGSSVQVKENWITSDIPSSGYQPNVTYNLLIVAEDATAAKIGFELTAENASSKVGSFNITESDFMAFTNGNKAITHKNAGTKPTNGIIMWTVEWTAPNVDSGDITFYAAFNAANGNQANSGDRIITSKYTVSPSLTTNISASETFKDAVYPNPAFGFVFVQSTKEIKNITVFDMQGRIVKWVKGSSTQSKVNLFDLKSGNYLVKAVTSDGEFTRKVQLKN